MHFGKLLFAISICFLIGFAGGLVTTPSIPTWYADLQKPFFNPPNWVFGPVWTTLYLLMGIALYRIWVSKKKSTDKASHAFLTQLGLNFLWSYVFFGLHMPWAAVIIIAALWGYIFYTIRLFKPIDKLAAYLLIPYLLWVTFASILNFSVALLN